MFNLTQLAYSSTGDLVTSALDTGVPILDVVKPASWGMHVFFEGTMNVPLCRLGGKPLFSISNAKAGLGLYAMVSLKDGKKIRSAAQFLGYYTETGGDFDALVKKFTSFKKDLESAKKSWNLGGRKNETLKKFKKFESTVYHSVGGMKVKHKDLISSVESVQFQLRGVLSGNLNLNMNSVCDKKNLSNLAFAVKSNTVIQISLGKKDNSFQFWTSFEVKTDLKDVLKVVPIFGQLVGLGELTVLMKLYSDIRFTQEDTTVGQFVGGPSFGSHKLDFIGYFKAHLVVNCGPFTGLISLLQKGTAALEKLSKDSMVADLTKMLNVIVSFKKSVCSHGVSLGFQIRVKHSGVVPYDTFLEYKGNKLRLSDLPVCDSNITKGISASRYSKEDAHHYPEGKCDANSDCYKDDGSYEIGLYTGNAGYCLAHPGLGIAIGCLGRCIKKLAPGANCSNAKLNLWNHSSYQHASCQSGQCACGSCSDGNNKTLNGNFCRTMDECESGWCEGNVIKGCHGVCTARRKPGEPDWKGYDRSCESNKTVCNFCTGMDGLAFDGKPCGYDKECASGHCSGTSSWSSCSGTC